MNEQEIQTDTDDTDGNLIKTGGHVAESDDTEGHAFRWNGAPEVDDTEGNGVSPDRSRV